jgi:hypothetical protein
VKDTRCVVKISWEAGEEIDFGPNKQKTIPGKKVTSAEKDSLHSNKEKLKDASDAWRVR